MFRLARRVVLRFLRRQLKSLSTAKMDPGKPFEEEQFPWYNPDQFYPVRIGEILNSSYKVLGKLGYGAYSTVWLCRNIRYMFRDPSIVVLANSRKETPALSRSRSAFETLTDLHAFIESYSSTSTSVHSVLSTMVNSSFVVYWEHSKSPALPVSTCA